MAKGIAKKTVGNCQSITQSGIIRYEPGAALLNAITRCEEVIANNGECEQADWSSMVVMKPTNHAPTIIRQAFRNRRVVTALIALAVIQRKEDRP